MIVLEALGGLMVAFVLALGAKSAIEWLARAQKRRRSKTDENR